MSTRHLLFAVSLGLTTVAGTTATADDFGVLAGDSESADGAILYDYLRSTGKLAYADDAQVRMDVSRDGIVSFGFPMQQIEFRGRQTRQVTIVQSLLEVSIDDLAAIGTAGFAPVRVSLTDADGNVLAVWLTVGFFEVVEEEQQTRYRFFAIIDRTRM